VEALPESDNATPSFFEFNPEHIPYQYTVIKNIKDYFIYTTGPHEILLSGSIGSAKSTLLSWLIISHVTEFKGARCLIGRKAMPDLKETLFQTILEMLDGSFTEGVDFVVNLTNTSIKFYVDGKYHSEIISRSWHDKKYKKFRSVNISMLAIEEATENDNKEFKAFYTEAIGRLGRIKHIANKECISILATNPDSPSHYCYDYFIKGSRDNPNRHVVYSRTEDNSFLPSWYIKSLREKYDEKMCQRLLEGKWIYISTDVIYYSYDPDVHFVLEDTKIDPRLPIRLSFDFNISKGKPMSSVCFQTTTKSKHFTFIDEVAIEGARTQAAIENWRDKGYLDTDGNPEIIIHGDASGRYGSSKSIHSDYEIIEKFLANYVRTDGQSLSYEIQVPEANPSIRDRHNIANGQLKNAYGKSKIKIDKRCVNVDHGFSKTQLKDGIAYTEDQTTEGQDMSNAVTYGIYAVIEGEYEFQDAIETY